MTALQIWTVYEHPADYPHSYVARMFDGTQPAPHVMTAPTLTALRARMLAMGLTRLTHTDGDDPVIVETWL